ncbi:MAG: hypothetical protein M1819_001570 [Sarea resinae]|nr:MAG: hypothetical protein M1819_001570 [Sarea resinae]
MGDLIGFEGYLNASTPYDPGEHNALWKTERHYHDFSFGNNELAKCEYPRFWDDDGHEVLKNGTEDLIGCRDSDFDQYGDIAAFGDYPEWQRQISKFAFVQDRLREWRTDVRERIQHMSCITIAMLDIDGFRMDKGLQITVDAQAEFADYLRQCASNLGKDNFYITGEIVAGNSFGSIYIGRGKEPSMAVENVTEVVTMTNHSAENSLYIRDFGKSAFDGAAFHYTIYRALTRFLGLDGKMAAAGDPPVNWVSTWEAIMQTNDLINANTGVFDPRHMYGVTNQDVFRWPGIKNGTDKQLLGLFIITLQLPGVPMLSWGEEQAFYVLDSTANNYVFGRQAMSSAQAWQLHGCYKVGSQKYWDFPLESSNVACEDDSVSLDHRDPSHPVRNIIKSMFEMRQRFPVLNDGYHLQQLSNQTYDIYLPGSGTTPTETGLWSVARTRVAGVQDFTGKKQGNTSIWLVYTNENVAKNYTFDCAISTLGLIAPFDRNTTVKNLFYPYDEYTLKSSLQKLWLPDQADFNGCLSSLNMTAWGYKAFVPKDKFIMPSPVITRFLPGHDQRLVSTVGKDGQESVQIQLYFSAEMDCDSVTNSLSLNSTTENGSTALLDKDSIECHTLDTIQSPAYAGDMPTVWNFTAKLFNVSNGVHTITIKNATNQDKDAFTNSVDHFMFRIGQKDNPMVFPTAANYSTSLLFKNTSSGDLWLSHKAAGADKFRYSTNWGSSYSDWEPYTGANTTITPQSWNGTSTQKWKGDHVMVQYWSRMTGSSDHLQQGDVAGSKGPPRRFPHLYIHGPFNEFGYDAGLPNKMKQDSEGNWNVNYMTEWPGQFQINAWGMNPDGKPDLTRAYGDIDNDTVLDLIPPITLEDAVVNVTSMPPSPYLAYRISVNDGNLRFQLIPVGSRWEQLALFLLLGLIPIITASAAVYIYTRAFYQVKFNQIGVDEKGGFRTWGIWQKLNPYRWLHQGFERVGPTQVETSTELREAGAGYFERPTAEAGAIVKAPRKTILIATMEYDIEDWGIKVKIGGLGVMAQIMGKRLGHQDLIWVVPCVGGIDFPVDEIAPPMVVTVLGKDYIINVQYHQLRNITYVLLDAPVFRQQTKSEPYPPRMDDIDSAIYYSAWNSCIAETMKRFPIDLYHINDYHGAIAPLHLLPKTIPCCLSLHNAEFQGLWPLRNAQEMHEVCEVFNLEPEIVKRYVQFGEVFNLLHAGASYLRIHQKGYGAVGVSTKYGKRSFARYPIFWGLAKIGGLPNPDPDDIGDWDKDAKPEHLGEVTIDAEFEAKRAGLKRQAQEWAGLEQREDAELFVFVGRWSMQKGIDLIADVFPAILEEQPRVQLICVGPVIDLYGKFAALKLDKMMSVYPGRVFSKPEFTALPPYIFSGAEFVLIPSRDEPFGLVAVEFGRKGALGVGARVGGLGQMPGWWYTVESTTTKHVIHQFKMAIQGALSSDNRTRAEMRARSAKQRFPVAQWVEDVGKLQSTAIKMHQKQAAKSRNKLSLSGFSTPGGSMTPWNRDSYRNSMEQVATAPSSRPQTPTGFQTPTGLQTPSRPQTGRAPSPSREGPPLEPERNHLFSLGIRHGPGHVPNRPRHRLTKSNTSRGTSRAPSPEREEPVPEAVVEAQRSRFSSKPKFVFPRSSREYSAQVDNNFERPYHLNVPGGLRDDASIASDDEYHSIVDEYFLAPEDTPAIDDGMHQRAFSRDQSYTTLNQAAVDNNLPLPPGPRTKLLEPSTPPTPHTPQFEESRVLLSTPATQSDANLSLSTVVGEKHDYNLQQVEPFFNDPTGLYFKVFGKKLETLNGKTSLGPLCIEEFLVKSEKQWFYRFYQAKMGKKNAATTPATSAVFGVKTATPAGSIFEGSVGRDGTDSEFGSENMNQFLLRDDYTPPSGVRKFLQYKIRDWPIYTFLLALGQIIAANSYQITLLTGEVGEAAVKLYVVATIYLVTSICWWMVFRTCKSLYVLSTPFIFYGLAFFFLGMAPYVGSSGGRGWMQNIATGMYAVASSSGSFFFALNFGGEGSAPVATWSFRACAIQGTQQIYVIALWYWGSRLNRLSNLGVASSSLITSRWPVTAITVPIACLLWVIGLLLHFGLPEYYRQAPGQVPSFYRSVFRRKIIGWFFISVLIQNFFLSAPYGRNWKFLWSSKYAPTWALVLLIFLFFVVIWAAFLYLFARLSTSHSWILPLFAIGLGAPRWCQLLWSTSNIGFYLPWAGSAISSALLSRVLWLWLGVLDALQGVGLGMILLQTLTRFHIAFTLISAQVLGSLATIVARACAPDRIGPGDIFPDFSGGVGAGLSGNAWFWIGMIFQIIVCIGFFMFFRKEQLSKP